MRATSGWELTGPTPGATGTRTDLPGRVLAAWAPRTLGQDLGR